MTFEGDAVNDCEMFDEADIGTALARFDELICSVRQLENDATQVTERLLACFAGRDWGTMAQAMADDYYSDDHRRVVGAGIRRGRAAAIENYRAMADVGFTNISAAVIATRGQRLALSRAAGRVEGPEGFRMELLAIAEIHPDEQIGAIAVFDPDDLDGALAELNTRYLAGEAAAHAKTWSAIVNAYDALNRHEISTSPDWVNIDHRRATPFSANDLTAIITTSVDLTPDLRSHVETVHLLNDAGAVVTQVSQGTSSEGFDAEWRMINVIVVDGVLSSRREMFDEADIDSALARFDELTHPPHRLENSASQVDMRFQACFAARDWDGLAEMLSDGTSVEDRRRVVNAGNLHGRDAELIVHAYAAVGSENVSTTVVAIRGQRLVLSHYRFSGADQRPDAFRIELLTVNEIDADELMAAIVGFDVDDVDAAFAELDARYLAGEAAAHAQTWSVITGAYAALNRHDVPQKTPDWVSVDHRQGKVVAPGEMVAHIRATWDLTPNISYRIGAVHRLTNSGAVITRTMYGTSTDGFEAEWRAIDVLTVRGGLTSRTEVFDEADLDAALARFDELSRSAPRLENTATRTWARLTDAFNRRDADGFLALTTADGRIEDRRKGLRGVLEGPARRNGVQALFETPPSSWRLEVEPIAIRGSRLSLARERYRDTDGADQPIAVELLTVMEVSNGDLVHVTVDFDPDDLDAAVAELDARYLAGEAAAHSRTWSVIAKIFAGLNRHEVPATTPDWINVDHRHVTSMAQGDMIANLRAGWDITPHDRIHIEAVHRLNDLGTVVTRSLSGTSQQGFQAEWRMVNLLTFEGELINRSELFDETDFDAAVARFDELSR